MPRHHDEREVEPARLHLPQRVGGREPRHAVVGEHDVPGPIVERALEVRLGGDAFDRDREALALEQPAQDVGEDRLVLDAEDAEPLRSRGFHVHRAMPSRTSPVCAPVGRSKPRLDRRTAYVRRDDTTFTPSAACLARLRPR